MGRSKTSRYYAENPEAAEKHRAYERKRNKEPGRKEYRRKHAAARRILGLKVGDECDASQTKDGKFVKEKRNKNRGRNGSNGKSTKK